MSSLFPFLSPTNLRKNGDRQLITHRLGSLSKSDKEAVKSAMKLLLATD